MLVSYFGGVHGRCPALRSQIIAELRACATCGTMLHNDGGARVEPQHALKDNGFGLVFRGEHYVAMMK